MTPLQQSIFELSFRLAFHEKRGDEFQVFFSRLMGLRYPSDFEATRPWGRLGDRKCDGYLRSTRTLFQCFAPNDVSVADTLGKVREDFAGALAHQNEFWDRWVLVHNSPEGRLPTDVSMALTALQRANPKIQTEVWGFNMLRKLALELGEVDLRSLLPHIPTPAEFADLGLRDIKPVVEHLAATFVPEEGPVVAPPAGKIAHNRLSDASAQFLTLGMAKSRLLGRYLSAHTDKGFGDRLAALFNARYRMFRSECGEPDDVLTRLFLFASGPLPTGSQRRDAAVWTVLAYFFEQCEIFDSPTNFGAQQ